MQKPPHISYVTTQHAHSIRNNYINNTNADNFNWFYDTSRSVLKAFQVVIQERYLIAFYLYFRHNSFQYRFRPPFETHHTKQLNRPAGRSPGSASLQIASLSLYFVWRSRIAIKNTKQSSVNVPVSYVQLQFNGQISSFPHPSPAIQDLSKALLLLFARVFLQFCTLSLSLTLTTVIRLGIRKHVLLIDNSE